MATQEKIFYLSNALHPEKFCMQIKLLTIHSDPLSQTFLTLDHD